ncbi:MAG: hypothetical protein QM761_08335 [Pseudoxanthomonas sp.]
MKRRSSAARTVCPWYDKRPVMPNSRGKLMLLAVSWALPHSALAQDAGNDAWTYRFVPYLWGSAIDGTLAHRRLPVDLHANMGFGDVWDHLDVGAMGTFEARKSEYGLLSDAMFVKLSTTAQAPVAGAAVPIRLKARTATGLVAFQYRWRESATGYLDLVAGARVWSARTRFGYALPIPPPPPVPQQYSGEQQETWFDLQIGVKGRHAFANRMFWGGWILAGRGESDLSTDAMLLAGYGISDRLAFVAGYRLLSTDYATSNGFKFDATLQGPASAWNTSSNNADFPPRFGAEPCASQRKACTPPACSDWESPSSCRGRTPRKRTRGCWPRPARNRPR